jgi:hypothetical protein
MTVAADGTVVADPTSFTSHGSLLYIDQRLTGFSYDDAPLASPEFDMEGDAVEFARVILHVLDAHPAIRAAGVVLVGESYGGARAQLILDDLFDYRMHADLAGDAQLHFDTIFRPAAVHRPAEIATQFFGAALIQPVVVGYYQVKESPGIGPSVVDTAAAQHALADPVASAALFGGRLEDVSELSGRGRHGARYVQLGYFDTIEQALESRLGPLDPDDLYFASGPLSDPWTTDTALVPPAFVRNLGRVKMLITNALQDETVHTTAIPAALGAMGITARLVTDQPAEAARMGEIVVDLPGVEVATIRFPSYDAFHAVTQTQPAEFLADVTDWLSTAKPAP